MSKIVPDPAACVITPLELMQATNDAPAGVQAFVTPGASERTTTADAPLPQNAEDDLAAALNEGLSRGREEGRRAAEIDFNVQLAQLRATVEQLLGYRTEIRNEVEREVIGLAFAVARRILRREATLDRSAASGIVRSCLEERSAAEVTRLTVHPDDLDNVRLCAGPGVDVVASEAVSRGGALIETTRGVLDARIDSQLDELEKGLADA